MTEAVEIRVRDPRPAHTSFEQVLIGTGFIGLTVLLTEHIALPVIERVLGLDRTLDLPIGFQVLVQTIHDVDKIYTGGLGAPSPVALLLLGAAAGNQQLA